MIDVLDHHSHILSSNFTLDDKNICLAFSQLCWGRPPFKQRILLNTNILRNVAVCKASTVHLLGKVIICMMHTRYQGILSITAKLSIFESCNTNIITYVCVVYKLVIILYQVLVKLVAFWLSHRLIDYEVKQSGFLAQIVI